MIMPFDAPSISGTVLVRGRLINYEIWRKVDLDRDLADYVVEVTDVETGLTAKSTSRYNRYRTAKYALKKVLEQLVEIGILRSKGNDDLEGITTSFAECIEDSSKCIKTRTKNGAIIPTAREPSSFPALPVTPPIPTIFSNITGTAIIIACLYVLVLGVVYYWFMIKQRTAPHHGRHPEHPPNEPLHNHHKFRSGIWFLGDPWQETVTSDGMLIRWDEIGIKIYVPPGAVPEDKPIKVTVRPCLSGPFVLPQGYDLASPVYAISQSSEFRKRIQLSMAHFANLQSEEDCGEMTFLTSRLSQRLQVQQRGVFQIGTQEGEISLEHFCKKAIARKRCSPGDMKELRGSAKRSKGERNRKGKKQERNIYSVQLYQNAGEYTEENVAAVCVSLHHPVYTENFKRCLEEWYPPPFRFRPSAKLVHFSEDKMIIKVPTDVQGWKIVPDLQPCEISKEEVDLPSITPDMDYSTVCTYPPKILLTISPPPTGLSLLRSLYYPLSIRGFVQQLEFNLQLQPPQRLQSQDLSPERQPSFHIPPSMVALTKHNIIQRIGTKYRSFGTILLQDHDGTIIDIIAYNHPNNTEEIVSEILTKWLSGKGRKPVSWETLICSLRDVGLGTLASDIEKTLP